MYARKDSVLVAAKLIVEANEIAKRHNGLATTGIFTTDPGTVNTMAHTTTFSLDLRHGSDEVLQTVVQECKEAFKSLAGNTEKGCEVEWAVLVDSPAVVFHDDCIAAVEQSAADVCSALPEAASKTLWKPMISGAGHDSCYTNLRCPTSMIFTPTREGISHNPTEYCSAEDWYVQNCSVLLCNMTNSTQVLLERVYCWAPYCDTTS
jgi:acetylornithine deacetylase/succinyl-diaminopimelate desuccinylase-like protein